MTYPNFIELSAHVTCGRGSCGRGSILVWWQYNTFCTSSFVDDVVFASNGPYGAWLMRHILKVTHQGAALGQCLMSVITLLLSVVIIVYIHKPSVMSHLVLTSSVEWSRCRSPSSLVCGQLLTVWSIVYQLTHGGHNASCCKLPLLASQCALALVIVIDEFIDSSLSIIFRSRMSVGCMVCSIVPVSSSPLVIWHCWLGVRKSIWLV